ncbi:hypothetical protein FP026_26640 [Rhizobium tropici]|uniref:Uncharacterized protein n=1 Tax=Rhizobium tropici TaxID=398 RepID=A0A5B0VQG5_RHITR|nr:hypothetical protein [Rhizobium tropici]KAA1176773.1 hypothetical protein FP026_26640 [Rhizobium tropici]
MAGKSGGVNPDPFLSAFYSKAKITKLLKKLQFRAVFWQNAAHFGAKRQFFSREGQKCRINPQLLRRSLDRYTICDCDRITRTEKGRNVVL